jgi:hypothetical protein
MEFLKNAEAYCESIGDDYWFKDYYTRYREFYSVEESVRNALMAMYGDESLIFGIQHA